MKPSEILFLSGLALALATPAAWAQTAKPEIEDIALAPIRLTIRSELGVTNAIEHAPALATNQWLVLTNVVVTNSPYVVMDLAAPATKRFYRVVIPGDTNTPPDTNAPTGMVLIPAGAFMRGDALGDGGNYPLPLQEIQVSAFYMDKTEVTKALWNEVKTWAEAHGYSFDNAGMGKAANHPVQMVNWYDVVKWCNARSEKEGRVPAYYTDAAQTTVYRTGQVDVEWEKWSSGYRLPTETVWEKAARGGASGQRFPWGDRISHLEANYGYHPDYQSGGEPYTSPVGSFAPNGYGLYDMAGNVTEWCFNRFGAYASGPQTGSRGSIYGSPRFARFVRGGSWRDSDLGCRVANRDCCWADARYNNIGFRSILFPAQ